MGIKDIKLEARRKLALNMHQAIVIYMIEYLLLISLIAIIVLAALLLNSINMIAGIVMICYGSVLFLVFLVGTGMISYAMADYYITSYKCKPYNIRRLGDTLARSGVTKLLLLNFIRTIVGFLLSLLLIFPGVIYLSRTSMANHLLIANPNMSATMALKASKQVMAGKLGSYVGLMFSFAGWWFLGILTLGLGFIFITPYINLSKTVYYKRNLQMDKTPYQIAVQPESPLPAGVNIPQMQQQMSPQMRAQMQQQVPPQMQQQMPPQMQQQVPPQMQQQVPPQMQQFQQEPHVPPIQTLGAEDVAEMTRAMHEIGNDAEVPEVPISQSVAKEPMHGISDERAIEDSDLVEIVKPLSTEELAQSDVLHRQIDSLFNNVESAAPPKRNYLSGQSDQHPDDFVTHEPPIDDDFGVVLDDGTDTQTPLTQDDEFNALVHEFEAEVQADEPAGHVDDHQPKPAFSPVRPPLAGNHTHHQARPAAPENGGTANSETESRIEKIRREREERLSKLRK